MFYAYAARFDVIVLGEKFLNLNQACYLLGTADKEGCDGKDCGKILYSSVCLCWEKSASVSASSTCTVFFG
jgi:hypothetical protein